MIVAKLSSQLAKIIGAPQISRRECLVKVWEYIKLNNLQDPANKFCIKPDKDLYEVFQKDYVSSMEVMKLLSPHFEQSLKLVKPKTPPKVKTVIVSPALKSVIGEAESRTEAFQKVWVYIKENNLQNPNKKKEILCDEKLKALSNKSTIDHLEIMGVLAKHYHVHVFEPKPEEPYYVPV